MRKASTKDIFRTIWKEKKRFFSIMMITVLGVTLMTGLEAGCRDLKISADRFYDSQKLFDISIMSTLGLTEEDVEAIRGMEGVKQAEGAFSEVVHTKKGDRNQTAEIKAFQENGLNLPYVVAGRLPESAKEIAVSENYLKETGKSIGDKLTIEEIMSEEEKTTENTVGTAENPSDKDASMEKESDSDEAEISIEVDGEVELEEEETANFPNTEFVITGTVIDVMDINNGEGSAAFRATPNADYTFFVTPDAVESEIYTAVYASLENTEEWLCYSEEYENRVEAFTEKIEAQIMKEREEARYQQITGEAYEKIQEKEEEMWDAFAQIEQEFEDAKEEIDEGWEEITDGRQELTEKEQEAKEQIADARAELEDAYIKLSDAWVQLNDAEKELHLAEEKLDENIALLQQKEQEAKKQLTEAEELLKDKRTSNQELKVQLAAKEQQLKESLADLWTMTVTVPLPNMTDQIDLSLEQAWQKYVTDTKTLLQPVLAEQMKVQPAISEEAAQTGIQTAIQNAVSHQLVINGSEYGTTTAMLGTLFSMQLPGVDWQDNLSLATGIAVCDSTKLLLEQASEELKVQKQETEAKLSAAWDQIHDGERQLEEGWVEVSAGRGEVIENQQKWQEGLQELEEEEQKALQEIADARNELSEGEQDLINGEQELKEHEIKYLQEKQKAEEKIAEARQKVEDIDMAKWYVQDRTSLSGYVNVDSDTTCIESLATVFTIVFFIVAILISLTTVTRMVEEERGLIGTYKALGFTDREIRRKYTWYALGASLLGAVLGDVGGFVILPEILFVFFKVMYLIPIYYLKFDVASGTFSGILFLIGIVGAAVAACYSELKHVPAKLMRPKAPKEGSRVILEYIRPLWKRMSFLNKVTARNLFRYKKRMFMTLFGIMGCTALLVFGLAIKDSVAELMPLQYDHVYSYDLLAAVNGEDNEKLLAYMENSEQVKEYLNIQVETVKLKNEQKDSEKVQLMILPDDADIGPYFTLKNEEEEPVRIEADGIYLTENASKILGLKVGSSAYIQKLDLTQEEVTVTSLIKNYLGNNIYMSESAYEKVFGAYEPNGVLAVLSESCTDQIAFSDKLAQEDWILSSVSTQDLKESFSQAFTLINLVVYVVLVLAACLAFVVLFTLASINISERERELATIKVLGFFDKEVHSYVNKETLILTAMGILLGLPVGAWLSSLLTDILNMPSIYFAVTIYGRSYWMAAGVAFLFAILVQLLTDKTLNGIDPVEALKSVE